MALFETSASPQSFSSAKLISGKGSVISKWAPFCVPTYVAGFDKLIHGAKSEDNPTGGGLPLSSPGVTTLAGGPGTGKSMFCYNMVAIHLSKGNPIIWFTLEKPNSEIAWNILNLAEILGLDLNEEGSEKDVMIPNFECYDYFSSGVGKRTAIEIGNTIIAWQRKTKGKIVVIDSITELTAYEMHLREVLKNLLTTVSSDMTDKNTQIAILMTSQYRGAFKDAGIAGGLAIGHRSNAVIQLEASYANNFDKKYYNTERGQQVRKIWVEKTASFAHETSEYLYNIGKEGIVSVSDEPLSRSFEGSCYYCSRPIDMTGDYTSVTIDNERRYAHTSCFLEQGKKDKPSRASAKPSSTLV